MARTAITSARTAITSAKTAVSTNQLAVRNFPYSIRFTTNTGYFIMSNNDTLEDLFHTSGGTFVAWFKQEALLSVPAFIMYSPTSSVQGWWLQYETGLTYPTARFRFGVAYTGSNRLYKTPAVYNDLYNRWVNICVSFDSTTPTTDPIICVNGVSQSITATGTGTEYITDNTKAWRNSTIVNAPINFGGEMRLIKGKQWTAAEMANYYFNNVVPTGGTAVGTWLFTEGSGNAVADASGNGNTMQLVNATWVSDRPSCCAARTVIS